METYGLYFLARCLDGLFQLFTRQTLFYYLNDLIRSPKYPFNLELHFTGSQNNITVDGVLTGSIN